MKMLALALASLRNFKYYWIYGKKYSKAWLNPEQ